MQLKNNIKTDVKNYLDKIYSWNVYVPQINDNHGILYLLFLKYGTEATKLEINKQIKNRRK
jgi:hypothetical protein